MALLEREYFLTSLADYEAEARRGEGRFVLVAGETGVGKTAFVEQCERESTDARWVWGTCDGLFTSTPLAPLLDLARGLGGALLKACEANAPREELFATLLRELESPGPLTVVVFEDVHWADDATLDLLRFLSRRLRWVRALLIATYRDDSLRVDHPLRLLVGEMASDSSTRRVAVPPLTAAAVGVLARGSDLESAELYRLTGGNPFYVTEVLHTSPGVLPASARDAVLARVARLGVRARDVLETAALLGYRVDTRLLEMASAAEVADLDACLASGMLVADEAGLRFRHEIARLAVEQSTPAYRRTARHASILDALRSSGSDDEARLAFHAEGAGDCAAVLRFAPKAAMRAVRLASHREAAAQYERALRCAEDCEPAVVADLFERRADQLALVDRWQEVADARQAGLELWRQVGDEMRIGDTLRRLSKALWRLCRGEESRAAAESALAILEPLPSGKELAWAYANLATQRMFDGNNDDAIELARKAQGMAQDLALEEVRCDALNTEGCALSNAGRPWMLQLEQALAAALAAGLEDQAGRAFADIYGLWSSERRFAQGERFFLDGVAYCDDHDASTHGTCLRGERASSLEKMGRWEEAFTLCSQQVDRIDISPVNRLRLLETMGKIKARRGDPDAWEPLDEARAMAQSVGGAHSLVINALMRIEAHWLSGDSSSAAREVTLAADRTHLCDPWEQGALAAWGRRLGEPMPEPTAVAEPYVRELAGDWAAAVQLWLDLDGPYDAALALLDSLLEADLREALRMFDILGATPAATITRRRMRQLGFKAIPAGPRASTAAHPLGLTLREGEVLTLLGEGLANVAIAGRLHISEKTVDHHVSAVLMKMGVPTRAAAVNRAGKLGLVGHPTDGHPTDGHPTDGHPTDGHTTLRSQAPHSG